VGASAVEDKAARSGENVSMSVVMSAAAIRVAKIRELAGLAAGMKVAAEDDGREFTRLLGYADADERAIVFAQGDAELTEALRSSAGLVLAGHDASVADARVLRVENPKLLFALIGQWMEGFREVRVHHLASVAEGVVVGQHTEIGAGTVVEAGAVLGEGCRIATNVTLYGCVRLGDRVVVQAGAVLGAMGFGYVREKDGGHVRFPQQGTLWIGDDVEIGANTTIDRGALGETRIGDGTKIDNLVHIGHNCVVGKNVLIAAQVGVSGSTTIGDGAVLAGQVGLGDHVTIGPGVILGGQGGVFPGKTLEGEGQLFGGTPAQPVKDYLRGIAKVRRLK
jgi:UDP-3-O-[3-hydroxymyristoyl] glucosamine N-acyltransferase